MGTDLLTWPGSVLLENDGDQGYTDISADLPSLGTTNLNAVWAPCAEEVWAVGQSGGIWLLSGDHGLKIRRIHSEVRKCARYGGRIAIRFLSVVTVVRSQLGQAVAAGAHYIRRPLPIR